MSGCGTDPIGNKPCSGKCTAACPESSKVWVLAACEGAGVLFGRDPDGGLVPLLQITPCSESVSTVANRLKECLERHEYGQLIIVGSPLDIAWVHSILPYTVARSVMAEVRYPLLASWFGDTEGLHNLKQALKSVVRR